MDNLSRIIIKGFKSIKELDLEMKPINVLIGANGAGKSNFINVFEFLKYGVSEDIEGIESYVAQRGGGDAFLFFGSSITQEINIDIGIQKHEYKLVFKPDYNNDLLTNRSITSNLDNYLDNFDTFEKDINSSSVGIYHFHNTSKTAGFKKRQKIFDCDFLRSDAKNIAPFLLRLQKNYKKDYKNILQTIQTVAPYFKDFVLRPIGDKNDGTILLRWKHKNDFELDEDFSANQLSDGTARFICMATLFLQPKDMRPKTIVLDEPEIGLHPVALTVLSEIIKSVANNGSQVIISTQSVTLANCFKPDDFIVVDYADGISNFRRLDDRDQLDLWLKNYQMGDIWNKNLLGGRLW